VWRKINNHCEKKNGSRGQGKGKWGGREEGRRRRARLLPLLLSLLLETVDFIFHVHEALTWRKIH
jgi:hypothetical protein